MWHIHNGNIVVQICTINLDDINHFMCMKCWSKMFFFLFLICFFLVKLHTDKIFICLESLLNNVECGRNDQFKTETEFITGATNDQGNDIHVY
jgi:hypothetical protein